MEMFCVGIGIQAPKQRTKLILFTEKSMRFGGIHLYSVAS